MTRNMWHGLQCGAMWYSLSSLAASEEGTSVGRAAAAMAVFGGGFMHGV
jgi:hypothetical protein